jgi:hypothetical protein
MTLALALCAGLMGGLFSRYIVPEAVHAQSQTPALKEVRAQSFVLVDENGLPRGIFAIERTGFSTLEAAAEDGPVYTLTRQSYRPSDFKPTLLPMHP